MIVLLPETSRAMSEERRSALSAWFVDLMGQQLFHRCVTAAYAAEHLIEVAIKDRNTANETFARPDGSLSMTRIILDIEGNPPPCWPRLDDLPPDVRERYVNGDLWR